MTTAMQAPIDFARARIGTKEVPGAGNNPDISVQFARCGHPEIVNDSVYWCAAEVGGDLVQAGYPCSRPRATNLMARSYEKYGVKLKKSAKAIQAALDAGHPVIAVWPRGKPPAGHVNLVAAVSGSNVECTDGNYNDQVASTHRSIKDAVCFVRPHAKLPHNRNKRLSPAGELHLKQIEEDGGRPALKAYDDGTGTATIGWGCTDGVRFGMTITEAQAQALFDYEIVAAEDAVHRLITRPITQGLLDALVEFFYNLGWSNCDKLIDAVNAGDEAVIRSTWMLFVHARRTPKGPLEVWPGLVNRRQKELALWTAIDSATPEGEAELKKWAPAEPPPKPGLIETMSILGQSRRMWAQCVAWFWIVVGVLAKAGEWISDAVSTAVNNAPDIVSDAQVQLNAAEQVARWFQINWMGVCMWAAAFALTVAIIRYTIDKREGKA